jgi:hypothetical protein
MQRIRIGHMANTPLGSGAVQFIIKENGVYCYGIRVDRANLTEAAKDKYTVFSSGIDPKPLVIFPVSEVTPL